MKIVSSARKLILKPENGAPVVKFPSNAKVSEYGANNNTPTVVVFNGTNPSWQGVNFDGYVIVNEVPEGIALNALEIYEQGGCTNISLVQALYYLMTCGCVDQYTTGDDFVGKKLSSAGRRLPNGSGIVKRDDRDLVDVWQEDNKFFVKVVDGARVIESDILCRTYRNENGDEINLAEVPVGRPASVV